MRKKRIFDPLPCMHRQETFPYHGKGSKRSVLSTHNSYEAPFADELVEAEPFHHHHRQFANFATIAAAVRRVCTLAPYRLLLGVRA